MDRRVISQAIQALQTAWAAVEQLPPQVREKIVKPVVTATSLEEIIILVPLRRLAREKQTRLAELMDRNNEGLLARKERSELKRLVNEVDEMQLFNSHMLARALRPELFNTRGQVVKRRMRRAVRETNAERYVPKRSSARQ